MMSRPHLSEHQKKLVLTGSCLVAFAAMLCFDFFAMAYFVVESRVRSYLGVLPQMMMLQRFLGAAFVTFAM